MAIRPRNDPVRLLGRRLLIAALFALVIVAGVGVWNAYRKERDSALMRDEAQARLRDLSGRQDELTSDIAKLETARGKEEVLRDQYALAAKGEKLIVIVNPSTSESTATSSAFVEWLHNTFPWW